MRPQFASYDDAVIWAKDQEAKMAKGHAIELPAGARTRSSGRGMTLGQLLVHTAEHRWKSNGPGGGPIASAKSRIIEAEKAIEALGGDAVRVASLDYLTIETKLTRFQEERGNAVGTTNRRKSALLVMLKEAVKLGVIDKLPAMNRKPETYRRCFRVSSILEQEMLQWARAYNVDFYDYLVLSLYLGARENQILRVRTAESVAHPLDPYVEDDFVIFPPGVAENKATQITVVPIRPIVREVVTRHRALTAHQPGRVLEGHTKRWVNYWFDKMKETLLDHPEVVTQRREGLAVGKDFTPHILRHEFCSRLGDAGFDLHEIQRFSGHATADMCKRYVRPNKVASLRRALRVPGAALEEGLPDGAVPPFAPTQPLLKAVRPTRSLTPVSDATGSSTASAELMKVLEANGITHLFDAVIAAQSAQQR